MVDEQKLSTELTWSWIPWTGATSLFAVAACTASAATVVFVSDNQAPKTWKVEPSVLLAIFSAVSNLAFNSALAAGVAISFWLCADRGTTLSQLHYIWSRGKGFDLFPSIRVGSSARRVAIIATLTYVVQFASGPLLQQSTQLVSMERVSDELLHLDLAQKIPDGWMGDRQNGRVVGFRSAFPAVQRWWKNETIITLNKEGYLCDGTCEGSVAGAGFTSRCSSSTHSLDMMDKKTDGSPVFAIQSSLQNNASSHFLRLTVEYVTEVNSECIATVTVDTCDLDAAVVSYPIRMQNSTVALRSDLLTSMKPVSMYVSPGDARDTPDGEGAGPLAGLHNFVGIYFNDNSTKKINNRTNRPLYNGPGFLADMLFQWDKEKNDPTAFERHCALQWNPHSTQRVLQALHDFMFRSALIVGNGTETQRFEARRVTPTLVYRSDMRYLAAALCALMTGIGLVGSLMWGWWHLRYPVSLSPLETARAFGAPALRGIRADAAVDQILAEVKDVPFKTHADAVGPDGLMKSSSEAL